jgi:hypothetical protein
MLAVTGEWVTKTDDSTGRSEPPPQLARKATTRIERARIVFI